MCADTDTRLRQHLLRSLVRRQPERLSLKKILAAVDRLDERALGESAVEDLRTSIGELEKDAQSWDNPDYASKFLRLTKALYQSRRISRGEYTMYALSCVESVHEERWFKGDYRSELDPIDREIEEIKQKHDLAADEYWPRGDGPPEYQRLTNRYSAVLHRKLAATLREFKLDDLAVLLETDPAEYKRLRERGRRALVHSDEFVLALRDVVKRYEDDARKAAGAGAYYAAIVILGAALEGLLVLRCLQSKTKALALRDRLPPHLRRFAGTDPTKWTFETLIEICALGKWLPEVESATAIYSQSGLAHILRWMRNLVHPARHSADRPWQEIELRDYEDAEATYTLILATLTRRIRASKVADQ